MIPKFRAWDKELKCWCPFRIYSLGKVGEQVIEFMNINQGVWYTNEELNNNFVLMQSTGFKDKNGVEIYERDVVSYTEDWDGFELECVDIASFAMIFAGTADYYTKNVKVLGNIYENPELLEEN